MGRAQRNYEKEYKEQAVKLAKEIGREGTGSAQRDTVRVDEGVAGGAAGSGTGQPYPQRGDEPGGGDDGITRYSGSTNFVSSLVGAFRRKVWS